MLHFLLTFTCTFYAYAYYNEMSEDKNFNFYIKSQYRTMFGDFDVDGFSTNEWLVFVLASLIVSIVMMNLLIAIISDEFALVMSSITKN